MPLELHHSILSSRRRGLAQLWATHFGTTTPFVFEIGCGHGHFLTAYASAHPERTCIGIDVLPERIERAERKRVRANLPNLHFIRAAAEDLLSILAPTPQIADTFILFPDPWPKRRHHKNRLLNAEFLSALALCSLPGARLHFRTDHASYFTAAQSAIATSPDWSAARELDWPFELETVFQQRAAHYHSLIAERR